MEMIECYTTSVYFFRIVFGLQNEHETNIFVSALQSFMIKNSKKSDFTSKFNTYSKAKPNQS